MNYVLINHYYWSNIYCAECFYFFDNSKVRHFPSCAKYFGKYYEIGYTQVSVFGDILVEMRENADQNNSEYGHFLCSEILQIRSNNNLHHLSLFTYFHFILSWNFSKRYNWNRLTPTNKEVLFTFTGISYNKSNKKQYTWVITYYKFMLIHIWWYGYSFVAKLLQRKV